MAATTRNDMRGHRAIGALLIGIGLIAMVVSMVMNWRFGWSLASAEEDRYLMAVLHSLVDPAAAGLVAAGGLMLAWGWRWQGWLALGCAGLLVAYSMISVFGFMSERIGLLEGHKAALATQQGYLKWVQGQQVNIGLPKSERRLMREDVKAGIEKLTASVRIIPDKHASAIAAATGLSIEAVQRMLVSVGSGVAQGIKFACLGFGFFLIACRAESAGAVAGDDASSSSTTKDDASGGGGGGRKRLELVDTAKRAPAKAPITAHHERALPQSYQSYDAGMPAHMTEYSHLKQRGAGGVPDGMKWSRERLDNLLLSGASGLSQQAIADMTGYTQPGVSRAQRRLRARADRKLARQSFHNVTGAFGGGISMRSPAFG